MTSAPHTIRENPTVWRGCLPVILITQSNSGLLTGRYYWLAEVLVSEMRFSGPQPWTLVR